MGEALLFPSTNDATRPLMVLIAIHWLRHAEKHAKLEALAWLLLSWKFDTWYRIKMWAMVNLLTALLSFFVVLLGMFLFQVPVTSPGLEICAFAPVVLASVVDFAEMFTGDQLVERYGGKLFKTRPT